MHLLIAWCGFLGAWLLFAGPVYQATIELADEEFERADFERATEGIPRPEPMSRWWLLVPPVAYVVRQIRSRRFWDAVLKRLDRSDIEQLLHFRDTASAWMFVALGAFLIAVKETWELHEAYEWPAVVFWALVAGMMALCIANTAMRIKRREAILRRAG